jgi:hypothetical protein
MFSLHFTLNHLLIRVGVIVEGGIYLREQPLTLLLLDEILYRQDKQFTPRDLEFFGDFVDLVEQLLLHGYSGFDACRHVFSPKSSDVIVYVVGFIMAEKLYRCQ